MAASSISTAEDGRLRSERIALRSVSSDTGSFNGTASASGPPSESASAASAVLDRRKGRQTQTAAGPARVGEVVLGVSTRHGKVRMLHYIFLELFDTPCRLAARNAWSTSVQSDTTSQEAPYMGC